MKNKILSDQDFKLGHSTQLFEEALSKPQVFFSLCWNKNRPLALVQLVTTLNSDEIEKDHLESSLKDVDGELSVLLGSFQKNDIVTVQFAVLAFAKIDGAEIIMNQTNPVKSMKVRPSSTPNKFKSIEKGKLWSSSFKYRVR